MAELVALEEYYCNYYFNDFIHQKEFGIHQTILILSNF